MGGSVLFVRASRRAASDISKLAMIKRIAEHCLCVWRTALASEWANEASSREVIFLALLHLQALCHVLGESKSVSLVGASACLSLAATLVFMPGLSP